MKRFELRQRARFDRNESGAAVRSLAQPRPRMRDLRITGLVNVPFDAAVAQIRIEQHRVMDEVVDRFRRENRQIGGCDEHELVGRKAAQSAAQTLADACAVGAAFVERCKRGVRMCANRSDDDDAFDRRAGAQRTQRALDERAAADPNECLVRRSRSSAATSSAGPPARTTAFMRRRAIAWHLRTRLESARYSGGRSSRASISRSVRRRARARRPPSRFRRASGRFAPARCERIERARDPGRRGGDGLLKIVAEQRERPHQNRRAAARRARRASPRYCVRATAGDADRVSRKRRPSKRHRAV